MRISKKQKKLQFLIVSVAVGLSLLSSVMVIRDTTVKIPTSGCMGPAVIRESFECPDIDAAQTQKGYPLTYIYITDKDEWDVIGDQPIQRQTDFSTANFLLNILIWYAIIEGTILVFVFLRHYIDGE